MNERMANVNVSSQLSVEEQSKSDCFVSKKATEILSTEVKKDSFIIDGLLAPGLTMLAGPLKSGKSWLSLQMALSIASGREFWGRETTKGNVLYMAFDDDEKRVKQRLGTLSGNGDAPDGFDIAFGIDGEGTLPDGLDRYLDKSIDTKVVIIDSLENISTGKEPCRMGYEHDYEMLAHMKKIADKHQVAVIVITHTGETKDNNDWMDNTCGSIGISGTADTIMWLLEKENWKKYSFGVTSRDFPELSLEIEFMNDTCQWECAGVGLNVRKEDEAK